MTQEILELIIINLPTPISIIETEAPAEPGHVIGYFISEEIRHFFCLHLP